MSETPSEESANAPALNWVEVSRAATAARAEALELVLRAMAIPAVIAEYDEAHVLIVRVEDADRARAELARFVVENRGWPPPKVESAPVSPGVGAALIYAALMTIVFMASRQGSYGFNWFQSGDANAELIRAGAWWRSVTALSLHADVAHLLGNIVFGGLFGVMLAQGLGAGPAWLLFVLTGAVGNLVNAWWQPPSHLAIGASTGVFGLLGAQVACDQVRRGRMHLRAMRRWAPIILGVALLAWLGGSGDRTTDRIDVAAHFFGFVAGLGLGAWLGWRTATAPISPRAQNLAAAAALGLVAISWVLAFR